MNRLTIHATALNISLFLTGHVTLAQQKPTTAPSPTPATVADVTIDDMTLYTKGPYTAFLCPFAAKSLGLTGTESATIKPTFPADTTLVWSWPRRETPSVIGFLQVAGYGNHYNTVPESPITPQQLNTITTLSVSHDLRFSGMANGFNVIYDYFLTHTANGNDNHLFEIEVFVHASDFAARYVRSVTQIGTTTISGVEWTVAIDTHPAVPDILFMPTNQSDVAAATFDLKAMHDYLIAKGRITGNEYYNGHSLGVETGQGEGKLTVKSASVTYK